MADTESRSPSPVPRASAKGSGRVGYVMAMAAGGLVVWGVMVHGQEPERPAVTPVQVIAATPPASSAYECAVRCPGYVEPDDSYHAAPSFTAPVIPTTGVVTVVVPAPVQATQPTSSKASRAAQPRQTRQSQPKAAMAQAASKAPKQSQPSTTTTVTQKTSTTSSGTTTTSTTTKTTTKG